MWRQASEGMSRLIHQLKFDLPLPELIVLFVVAGVGECVSVHTHCGNSTSLLWYQTLIFNNFNKAARFPLACVVSLSIQSTECVVMLVRRDDIL